MAAAGLDQMSDENGEEAKSSLRRFPVAEAKSDNVVIPTWALQEMTDDARNEITRTLCSLRQLDDMQKHTDEFMSIFDQWTKHDPEIILPTINQSPRSGGIANDPHSKAEINASLRTCSPLRTKIVNTSLRDDMNNESKKKLTKDERREFWSNHGKNTRR